MATRNAWLNATADGRSTSVGLGPRAAGGWLSASLTLRTASGDISEPLELTAGGSWNGDESSSIYVGNVDSGGRPLSAHAYIRVPASLRVFTTPLPDGGMELHIVQRDGHRPESRRDA